jgi:hypothetical protein
VIAPSLLLFSLATPATAVETAATPTPSLEAAPPLRSVFTVTGHYGPYHFVQWGDDGHNSHSAGEKHVIGGEIGLARRIANARLGVELGAGLGILQVLDLPVTSVRVPLFARGFVSFGATELGLALRAGPYAASQGGTYGLTFGAAFDVRIFATRSTGVALGAETWLGGGRTSDPARPPAYSGGLVQIALPTFTLGLVHRY